jgi:hypothetical protein
MPFLPAGVGAAVAGGVASAGATAAIGALAGGKQSSQAAAGADLARSDLAPFRTAGTNALGVASDLSGANGPDAATAAGANFHTDPGYNFMMSEGLRGVNAAASANGMFRSGATAKGEMSFASGLADQSFNQYYNRLYNLSTLGETAAAGGAALAQSAGNTQANITGGIGAGLGNTVNSLFSNPKVVSGISSLFGGSGSGGSVGASGLSVPEDEIGAGY